MPSSSHGSRQIRTTTLFGSPKCRVSPEGHTAAMSPARQATHSLKASQSLEPTTSTVSFKTNMFSLVSDYRLWTFLRFPPCGILFIPHEEYFLSSHQSPRVHQTNESKGHACAHSVICTNYVKCLTAAQTHTHAFCLSLRSGISLTLIFMVHPHFLLLQAWIYKERLCVCVFVCLTLVLGIELKSDHASQAL